MKKVTLTILLIAMLILTCFAVTSCGKEYTVTWQNWDGTVLEVDNVKEETTPTFDGMTPTKEGNEQYAYEFSGWDKEISAVTGDTVYVAQFNEILLSYPIVWQNWDGTILQQSNENYGVTPTYNGETPFREATAEHTYTFSGWTPTVDTVTGSTTYVAQFTSTVNTYSITWQNRDGTVLQMSTVPYGEMPSYPGYDDPKKAPEEQYSYIFSGWSPSVEAVTGDVTYVAQFTAEPRIYTVYWKNWDGVYLAESEYEYGATSEYPDYLEEPTRHPDKQYIYTFAGWSSTVDVVDGTITYVAEFSKELQKYTVTWQNWDGTTLETDENVEYGTMPTYDGEAPVREPLWGNVYIFSGWSPGVDAVTGDVTYRAQFTSETAKYTVTWTNWDGTVLEVDEGVPYGTTPTYDGETPTKADDIEYTYTFSSWNPYVTGYLTEDVTYVARFTSEYRRYKVTWKNWDGSVLRVDEVEYGRIPEYSGETPTKPRTDTEAFDFVGWDKPQASVEGEQTYVAVFDDVWIYQVKYNLDGGSASDIEKTYKRVNETYFLTNVIPTKAGYRFVGWNNAHESRVYQPGNYFDGNFDVEFFAIWERYEPCSTCDGNGYITETCTDCNGQGEWDEACGNHDNGYKCPRCGTKYGFMVYQGIGQVCSSCFVAPTYTPCANCGGDKSIHKTCASCNKLGYIAVTCTSCEGRGGVFEAAPTVSYKTTTKVELVYIEGYEYSKDGQSWQASPLFENLYINTQYTFYQRRASTETVPFGATSISLIVTTDDYYSVTYELNGGSSNYNPERYADNVETVLSGAEKTGYTFLGWYDADGNKIEALGNGIYGDLVLYAKWNDGNLYTVSFNVNGGDSEIEPITVQYGKEYTLPTPVRTGYTFRYWYGNGSVPSPSVQGSWTIAQDVELTASWEVIYYNITYVLDGGYYEYGQARYSYTIGDTFTLSYPQKTGYTFVGWTYDGQDTPVLDVTISKGSIGDKEFTAHWASNKYTVTLDANGGVIEDETFDVIYGSVYTLPTPTRTGYTFDGWYNGDTKYSGGTWEGTESLEVVAKWKANSYEITLNDTAAPDITVCFDHQSDSHYNHTVTLANGRILERPANPKRENYVFTGWYTDSTCTARYDFTGVITDDMTLYAGWMPMNGSLAYSHIQIDPSDYTSSASCYTLHTAPHYTTSTSYITYIYMVAEETGIHSIYWKSGSTSSSYSYYIGITNLSAQTSIGCDVEVNTLSYRSCTFACSKGDMIVIQLFSNGYSSTAQLYFSGFGKPPASDCIATPRCEYKEQSTYKYLVEYDKNGMLPTPIRPHYAFLGWYNGEEKVEPGVWKIVGDTTLVAKWERIEYEITYNLDGGTNASANPSYYTQDDKITLAPPTKPGYEFLGWTGSNGDVPELNVTFSGEDFFEREYTAHWELAVYTIGYVMHGGTNPAKNPTAITMLDEFELKDPTKAEYTFEGWYLDDEFTQPISSLTNVTSNITLYAKFAPKQYTATFDSNGAETSDPITITLHTGVDSTTKTVVLNNGDSFSPYDCWQPKVYGYVFVGWMYNSELVGEKIEISSDIDLYAKWVENPNGYPVLGEDLTSIYEYDGETYFFISHNYTRIYYELTASKNYLEVKSPTTGLVTHTYSASTSSSISADGLSISSPYFSQKSGDWEKNGYATLEPGTLVRISCSISGDYINVHVYGGVGVEIAGTTTHNNTITVSDKRTKSQEYDSIVNVPNVSKIGYYVEWYDENGNLMTDTWKYTQDQMFIAKWQPINYNIVYNLDGGTNSMSNPSNYSVEDVLTLSDPSKTGYTFEGWYLDSDFTKKITSIDHTTGDYTLYAKFIPNAYNATLDFDGGIVAPAVTFVSEGEILDSYYFTSESGLKSYYPPTNEGYIFAGWYLDESCKTVFDFSAVITKDTTLYAKWITSDMTYHQITVNEIESESIAVNGTNEIMITFVPIASGEITISTASQLDVKGILYDQDMLKVAESDDISDVDFDFSITYYVQAGKQYTIAIKGATTLTKGDSDVLFSFDGSMGISGTTYTSFAFDVVYDSSFELPVPTKEGYEFLGWFDSDGNAVTSSNWNYAQDTTFYAQWVLID